MQPTNIKLNTSVIKLRPTTPRARLPLPRMMNGEKQGKIRQSKAGNEQHSEELDEEILEDSYSDSLESDSNTEPSCPSVLRKRSPSNEPSNTQAERSRKKREEIPIPSTSKSLRKPKPPDNIKEREKPKRTIRYITLFLVIICIIIALVIYNNNDLLMSYFNEKNIHKEKKPYSSNDEIEDFGASINAMSHIFKNQHSRIWDEIYSGVVDIIDHPKKRSVFFMFSSLDDPMICLAKMIGNVTKTILHTENNLWLEPSDFGNDHGWVIKKFQERIREQKVVIVENLLDIHPNAMRAFHNLCDSENPLVNQTIYILTMIATGYEENDRPIDFVEKQLRKKLKGKINPDKLQPLIARVTDGAIIPVQPEPHIKSCPLRY